MRGCEAQKSLMTFYHFAIRNYPDQNSRSVFYLWVSFLLCLLGGALLTFKEGGLLALAK